MKFSIERGATAGHRILIIDNTKELDSLNLAKESVAYAKKQLGADATQVSLQQLPNMLYIYLLKQKGTDWQTLEAARKAGAEYAALLGKLKASEVTIENRSQNGEAATGMAQGIALASYQFLKYRSERDKLQGKLAAISFAKGSITPKQLEELTVITDAIYKARTLVNEPLSFLGAEQLSAEIKALGKEAGFKVTVLGKAKIEAEGMGGILAVNRGSIDPPTFTIMEYKPAKSVNKQPIVLVGKGIVYDTGGLSLKPTPNSMDRMKSDMSGAALVSAAMYAIARLAMPLHVIALVPATDNRPGENAYVPGDVIQMYSGTTVEVLNTDAEGRLVLGDALHWAKRYKPELVFDFATLTGAASAAVGEHGIVCMGTAGDDVKMKLNESGRRQYERLVEYPLWDEYGDQIKSDIADIKNVGGATGGAITAGKFLEKFVDYPWMHFDIAGVSFATGRRGYMPVGGTAFGLRMLLDFLMNYSK